MSKLQTKTDDNGRTLWLLDQIGTVSRFFEKGQELDYKSLEMAEYLLPECEVSNKDKNKKNLIRTEMNDLAFNYGN